MRVAVNGPSGHLCSVDVDPNSARGRDVKEAIQEARGIPCIEQRLICGLQELEESDHLQLCPEHPEVTLVRRSQQQVEWLRLAREDWSQLLNEPAEVWEDRSVVITCVSSCGWALRYASGNLRRDEAVVLAAVKQNGLAIQFAAEECLQPDLALQAVAQCARSFQLCGELCDSRDFVLRAVQRNGHVLKYVKEALQDEEVVSAAVEQCGSTLSDVLGTSFEHSSRRSKIKHVLQDKGVLGAMERSTTELPQDISCAFFGFAESLAPMPSSPARPLLELSDLGLPVVPGFCLTESSELKRALAHLEAHLGRDFGGASPLLLSLSGAGGTVTGLGLSDEVAELMAQENANCVYDCYRRFVLSYASVVRKVDCEAFHMELGKVQDELSARDQLGGRLEEWQLPTHALRHLVETYKEIFEELTGEAFPQDPQKQLSQALEALQGEGGVLVQSMVFGNQGVDSGVGVLELKVQGLHGTWLPKAQREDLRWRRGRSLSKQDSIDWAEANGIPESVRESEHLSLEEKFLPLCAGLAHCKDVLCKAQVDLEAVHFAVQQGRLWLLGPASPAPMPLTAPGSTCESSASEDFSFQEEEEPQPMPGAFFRKMVHLQLPHAGGFRLWRGASKRKPTPETQQKQEETQQSARLPLPLWQTMLAGGLACVMHRTVASSMEDFHRGSRQVLPVLQKNLWKCSAGFPFGAVCCSLYVNFLRLSGERAHQHVSPLERFSCASAAVTLASMATYPLQAPAQGSALQHGVKALRSANPVAAVELCGIDLARQLGQSYGFSHSMGLLFASGCAAGSVAQSMVHAHTTVTQRSESRTPREKFMAFCRATGPALLKHGPAVGVNSLVRVGLVTHFMSQT